MVGTLKLLKSKTKFFKKIYLSYKQHLCLSPALTTSIDHSALT